MIDPTTRRLRHLCIAVAALVVALALGRLAWLPAHAPLNVLNEGWNAGHAVRLFGSGSLYPAPDALIANNYPPLSFLIVGGLGTLIGDHIVAGRIVALCAEIATGGAIYAAVLRLTGSRRWAAAGAMLFAGFAVTLLRHYLAMNDPQWLAQGVMAWALVVLVPRRGDAMRPGRVVAAAALVVVAGLIKHNLVAMPLAATIWIALVDRRALTLWLASGVGCAAIACAALYALWGTDVFVDVLMPARSYSLIRMLAHGAPLALAVLPGLLASRPLFAASRRDRRMLLPLLLLAVAIPTAILQRSGDGVDINAVFETAVALAIAAPTACALRRADGWRWLGVAALPAIALIPVAAMKDVRELAGRNAAVAEWPPFLARIAATRGPVACDNQAMCYWAGRQSGLDFFALKQRLLKGDVPALDAALDRHDFALIAMRSENPGWHENRLIPAIRTRYRTVYARSGFELLEPR